MKILNKMMRFIALPLIILLQLILLPPSQKAFAATSPNLGTAASFSVLGGQAVTNTGSTTTTAAVGVSSGTSITGFPPGFAGGATHSNDASAIAAQVANLAAFTTLDQTCDQSFGAVDLTATFPSGVAPGVYCSTSSFSLTGNLKLTGSGVWIFKTASTLITSPGSSVTGGDPCNVWWRVGSSVTLDTTTSFIGNILALNGVNAMNTGATLNGRLLVQDAGTVTLDTNTISGPTCSANSINSSTNTSLGKSASAPAPKVCVTLDYITPVILESKRVSPTSVSLSWGPYSGIDTFSIRYGLENGNWLYNTTVTGFSTTLNDLPPNQPIWVQIAATDNCSIGSYGEAKLVGGPGLPNTGLAPQKTISWYIPAGITVGISILLGLIQKKYRFSSRH